MLCVYTVCMELNLIIDKYIRQQREKEREGGREGGR